MNTIYTIKKNLQKYDIYAEVSNTSLWIYKDKNNCITISGIKDSYTINKYNNATLCRSWEYQNFDATMLLCKRFMFFESSVVI